MYKRYLRFGLFQYYINISVESDICDDRSHKIKLHRGFESIRRRCEGAFD